MKITDLHVDGFGVWNKLTVDRLSDEMTVFFGRNEAGKTTLLEFIRTVLYGFSEDRRRRYLAPVRGPLAGGSVYVSSAQGNLEVQRHVDPRGDAADLGDVALTDPNGKTKGKTYLDRLLSGVDEPTFNNVFAIGLRELQELATLDDTEAAEQLYRLSSGLDRVSLIDVMRHLRKSQHQLLGDGQNPSEIAELLTRRDKLQQEIDQLSARGSRWSTVAAQNAATKLEISGLEDDIRHIEAEARIVEIAIQVADPWRKRDAIDVQLDAIGPVNKLSDNIIDRIEELNNNITARQEKLNQTGTQRVRLREQARALPINRSLWSQRCRIDAVCEHAGWIDSLESQIGRLETEVAALRDEVETHCEPLGVTIDTIDRNLPDISDRTLKVLRGPARALRSENERLSQAREHQDTGRNKAQLLQQQLDAELADRGQRDLSESLTAAGDRVAQLRRRVQIEERIDKMEKTRDELREDIDELLEEQILPGWKLLVCGIPFVLGVVLILLGIFFPKIMAVGWAVALLGIAGVAVAVVMKVLLERNASNELDDCNDQLERLRDQIKQAKADREELDAELPAGGGALDARLSAAETELSDLEKLLPLEAELQEAKRRSESARLRMTQSSDGLKAIRNRWVTALTAVGLPTDLTPKSVKVLAQRCDRIKQAHRRYLDRKEELDQRRTELYSLTDRVERLWTEVGGQAGSDRPQVLLRNLGAAMSEQKQLVERRRELSREFKTLGGEHRRLSRGIEHLSGQRRAILAEAGVTDEADLRRLIAKQTQIRELRSERKNLTEKITAIIGGKCSEDSLGQQLSVHRDSELEKKWNDELSKLETTQSQLAKLHERRGQLSQELKSLAEDRRLDTAKLELGCVEKRLDDSVERCQAIAVTSALLESIRDIYEAERQPETLNEASRFLAQLTVGAYTRVWTPLGDDVLRVDDADGNALPVEVLSCGTRETVFLSLRLALAAAYARRGAVLPIVLDDVLVNFDVERSTAAAKVLRDFAKNGHQVLLFTCHEHIMQIFQGLHVEVRKLPSNTRGGVSDEILTAEEVEDEFEEIVEEPVAEEFEEEEELLEDHEEDNEYEVDQDDATEDWEAEEDPEEAEEFDEAEEEVEQEQPAFTWESADALWEDDAEEAA